MSETRYVRAEVSVDGRHIDAQLVKTTPETGALERLTLTFPVSFKGFLTMGKVDVKVVVEFDPPVSALDDAVGTPRETSAKLDHTLQAYGRLERRHYEVKRENKALRDALEEIARLPCQYPDDPDQDRKMALDSVRAQETAATAVAPPRPDDDAGKR